MALHGDWTHNLRAIIARRLSRNVGSGDIYGGIYATRLTAYFEIPIKFNTDYELPTSLLDFEVMNRHRFTDYGVEPNVYQYSLVFDMYHIQLLLPCLLLLYLTSRTKNDIYYVTYEEAKTHQAAMEAARLPELNAQRSIMSFH